jgi:hypothetical protein
MPARNRTEGEDQDDEYRTGRDGVRQQGNRDIPARQAITHDARPDDGRQQHRRPDTFSRGRAHV